MFSILILVVVTRHLSKLIELYTSKGRILLSVNHTSVKLIFFFLKKRQGLLDWIKLNQNPTICCFKRHEDTERQEGEE